MFDHYPSRHYDENANLTRRQALSTLAVLPLALLSPIPCLRSIAPHPEEFLPECAASITACWSLLNGDGLATVERTLPVFLPMLVAFY